MICEKEVKFTDLELLIRELTCNGTQDCENGPECPEDYDGCIACDLAENVCNYIEQLLREERKAIEVRLPEIAGAVPRGVDTLPGYMIAGIKAYKDSVIEKLREETDQ